VGEVAGKMGRWKGRKEGMQEEVKE